MGDAGRERAFRIAAKARRYALLSERPELLYPDAAVRAERLISEGTKGSLDVLLLAGVDELDRLCAAAVAALSREAPRAKPILSLLGVLPADYLLAMHYALPVARRGQCSRDGVWAHHLSREPDGIAEAINRLAGLAVDDDLTELDPREQIEFRRFTEQLQRRALEMPHELSETDEALAVAGERALSEVMGDGG